MLVFYKRAKATYGEETVCLNVGMELNFRCKYALDDVTLSSDIAVSGQDDDFENEGEGLFLRSSFSFFFFCETLLLNSSLLGELIYTMEADSSVQIGQPVSGKCDRKRPLFTLISHLDPIDVF